MTKPILRPYARVTRPGGRRCASAQAFTKPAAQTSTSPFSGDSVALRGERQVGSAGSDNPRLPSCTQWSTCSPRTPRKSSAPTSSPSPGRPGPVAAGPVGGARAAERAGPKGGYEAGGRDGKEDGSRRGAATGVKRTGRRGCGASEAGLERVPGPGRLLIRSRPHPSRRPSRET